MSHIYMAKSFKYKDNMYLDTKGIVHNRKLLADIIYPVGSIYISVNNTNPSTYYGGTWVQIKDRFLLACGDTYSNGATGGSATNSHQHWQTVGCDGSLYISQSHTRSRVIREQRTIIGGGTGNELIRQDSTYEETIDIMPPYLAVYVWKRTA